MYNIWRIKEVYVTFCYFEKDLSVYVYFFLWNWVGGCGGVCRSICDPGTSNSLLYQKKLILMSCVMISPNQNMYDFLYCQIGLISRSHHTFFRFIGIRNYTKQHMLFF